MFCLLLILVMLIVSISSRVIVSQYLFHSHLSLFSTLTLTLLSISYSLSLTIISLTFISTLMIIKSLSLTNLIQSSNTLYLISISVFFSHFIQSQLSIHPFIFSTRQYSFKVISTSSYSNASILFIFISFYSIVIFQMNTIPLSLSSTSKC